MKRLAVFAILAALPAVLFGSTQHYIVVTAHPYQDALRSLPSDDFTPAGRLTMRVRPFHTVMNGFDAELSDDQVKRLLASGEVENIEPVVERHVMADSITPGQQTTPWGVSAVHAPEVWPVTKGSAINGSGPIHVAVIDTGIDYNSPDLKQAYKGGKNYIANNNNPLDDFGHGTHVSGIIAAADDGEGVVGVAPGVDIYAFKVLDQCGSGSTANVIHAIDDIIALKNQIGGNWIANLSLGSDTPSDTEQAAFMDGETAGILFFAAAGNSFDAANPTTNIAFPADYPGVVSVGAIDSTDKIASFSQRGPDLKVVAPGVDVLSTIIAASVGTNDGRTFAGTTPNIVKNDNLDPLDGFCLPKPSVSGLFVFCGFGGSASDFPAAVSGKIALISRGNGIKFVDKALNAKAAGAIGVIVFDNMDEGLISPAFGNFPTASVVPTFPPFVFISKADGATLQSNPNATVSLGFGYEGWALEQGTSMATPHATGVAALAWAVAPNASATDIQNAVINNATDLGDPGVDSTYGHGLVNALAAARQLNLAAFSAKTGRTPGRRKH